MPFFSKEQIFWFRWKWNRMGGLPVAWTGGSHSCHRFWFGEVFNSDGFTL